MITGLIALMNGSHIGPINLGNPNEYTITTVAETIQKILKSNNKIKFMPIPSDDPKRRKPDISRARELLNWSPSVTLYDGLLLTINSMKKVPNSIQSNTQILFL